MQLSGAAQAAAAADTVATTSIAADYELRPRDLARTLEVLTAIKRPAMVWGPPGCGKSDIAQQVAANANRRYQDIRALLFDPVDLHGLPWRDPETNQTRWAPPEFLPHQDNPEAVLMNFEELPASNELVQAALYGLILDRTCGEYRLPENVAMIACGNRQSDQGISYQMPVPLARRFVHIDLKVHADDWCGWAAANDIEPEVLAFIQLRPDLLHVLDPESAEMTGPCPRTWEFASRILARRENLEVAIERALYRGTVGEEAAIEFMGFLRIFRQMPHPRGVLADPDRATIPANTSALLALCGALYRLADDTTFDAIVTYAQRLARPEIGQFLIHSCLKRVPGLQNSQAFIRWAAARTA